MKRLKIKWINVIKMIMFIFCIGMIIHDLYMLTIYSWVTGNTMSWTWLGFTTFILFLGISSLIYDDFEEQEKSATNIGTVTRTSK